MLVPSRLRFVILVGVGGTGKTTLGTRIASWFGNGHFVNTEAIKSKHGEVVGMAAAGPTRDAVFIEINEECFRVLKIGKDVVIDAPQILEVPQPDFVTKLERELARRDIAAEIVIIHVRASLDDVKRNLRKRNRDRDKDKLSRWDEFVRTEYEAFHVPHRHLEIWFPEHTLPEALPIIMEYLDMTPEERRPHQVIGTPPALSLAQ